MKHPIPLRLIVPAFVACSLLISANAASSVLPEKDERAAHVIDLNTPRSFPNIASRVEWEKWSEQLRQQILVSNGLWPMPDRPPIKAHFSGRIERDGYSMENVYFETYPGFYLAGNLYRPLGQGEGPFPGVLNPHGHWREGRLVDQQEGSVAARCIQFARHGMVAFAYDMPGYNDTIQVNHEFARAIDNQLWNISLMGLQTWNSIRALDFLESLPEVDKTRLACTGGSGGGTQTFMLAAIDDRLATVAPVVMVSHSMQGGCLCENAPGLRVRHSNMEIAAACAPAPQILVAATGDWTRATPTVEGPAIAGVYELLGAPDHFHHVIFDYKHNYNQTSREAVYEWFGRWLFKQPPPSLAKELPYTKDPDEALRIWPDGKLPADALTESELIEQLKNSARRQLEQITPRDRQSWQEFHRLMFPAWQRTLQLEFPETEATVRLIDAAKNPDHEVISIATGRQGRGDRLPALFFMPLKDRRPVVVILVSPEGKSAALENGKPSPLVRRLLNSGHSVLAGDLFLTGELADAETEKRRDFNANYFTTYNRTDLQERVQDILTLSVVARTRINSDGKVILWGTGAAGLWSLLAAPGVDGVIADCQQFNLQDESAYLQKELFVPGILKMGGFTSALALAAPNHLLLHNTGEGFDIQRIAQVYNALAEQDRFQAISGPLKEEEAIQWLQRLK
jgi:dienelactone hydrolase